MASNEDSLVRALQNIDDKIYSDGATANLMSTRNKVADELTALRVKTMPETTRMLEVKFLERASLS